jgi:hypothetical protein
MSVPTDTPRETTPSTDAMRRTSRTAGILYLITFVSIPTLVVYSPVKHHVATFLLGTGSVTGVKWGALSEVVVGLAGISTALVLFPILKRQNETAALGVVAARLVETTLIFVGAVSMLTITTLRHDIVGASGSNRDSMIATGHSLVAVYNWTFLLSQALMPAIVDALLGYLLYRSRLVPRLLPVVALVGAPLLVANDVAIFFGAYAKGSTLDGLAALPIAGFELAFGIWLIVKGFNPSSPLFSRPNSEAGSASSLPQQGTYASPHREQGAASN